MTKEINKRYTKEVIKKMCNALYLEVETSIAEDIHCMVKQLLKDNERLKEVIEEVQQTQEMLYNEHYDLQSWRNNHIVTELIFNKALEDK